MNDLARGLRRPLRVLPFTALAMVLLLAVACGTAPVNEPAPRVAPVEIIKNANDTRDYRYLELSNGLQVLLISDELADKSAASLTVFRGSFQDPDERPGLAHFLEHMLFIGTEKYPEPDGYFNFVEAHGGSANAYTAGDHTNYYFDIQPEEFREGLDRFAHFFISPLFQKEYVEREKNAVDSEHQLQIKEDSWRSFAVQKLVANPGHPASQFNIGNLETLKGDVHSALLEFFDGNYSANRMGLVVMSREQLDEMQPWVTEIFSAIKNRNLPQAEIQAPLFLPGQLPATLRHNNVRDESWLNYTFPVPSTRRLYEKKPVHYLTNLIGHEGDGSLYKLLKGRGWVSSLSAGENEIDDNTTLVSVSIELTPEGAEQVPEISALLFAYLDMLRREGAQAWFYQEAAQVADLAFRFREKTGAISTVSGLAPRLALYPPRDLLVAPYLMEAFDAELIGDFLSRLNRDNVLMTVSGPGYRGRSTEKWFDVSYDLERGPIAVADLTTDALRLPASNPFLPDSLALAQGDSAPPEAVVRSGELEIYLDTDLEFLVPRTIMRLSLRNEGGLIDLADVAAGQLYARLVRDGLNALTYPAFLAGVGYGLASTSGGFLISIYGYHDKQLVLLDEVLARLTDLDIDAERFALLKETMLRDLANLSKDKPFEQSYGRLLDDLVNDQWPPEQMIEAVTAITPASLTAWRDWVFGKMSVLGLVHGNAQAERVDELTALLRSHLTLKEVTVGKAEMIDITGAGLVSLDIDHDDAAMVLYVQDPSGSFEDGAKSALLTHLLAPAFFSSLRTDQQLGYAVFVVNTVWRNRGGISFVIQSPVAGPDELRKRTLAFASSQVARLEAMPEAEFAANKQGLIVDITQRDRNLGQRAARYWQDLDEGITTFDSREQLAAAIAALGKEDMLQYLGQVKERLDSEYLMVVSEGKFGRD